jgi:PAS domain S-box-containing protein
MTELSQHADLLRELGTNLGLLGVLVLGYAMLDPQSVARPARGPRIWLLGLVFGLSSVLAQLSPLLLAEGVKVDARAVVLGLAGAYIPLPGALLATLLSCAYRLQVGGVGAWFGVLAMLVAVLLGWLWEHGRLPLPRARLPWLLSLGLAVAASSLGLTWMLPGGVGPDLASRLALPVLLVFGLGTVALGSLLDLVVAHGADVRALQQALHEREIGEQRLELALEASGAALWEWHVGERRIKFSDNFFEQLGYPPDHLDGTQESWRALLHPDDLQSAVAAVKAGLEPGSPAYVNEYRMRDAKGQWRWMLARGRLVRRGPAGEPMLMVGTHLDVDAMRRQQAALLASHERFQKIYQTTPDAMGISRISDGSYVDVNEGFLRLTGYARAEVLGHGSLDLGLWDEPAQRAQLFEEFARAGLVDSMEITVRRKDGQLLSGLLSVRRLVEQGEDCMLFIYRDVSERRRLLRDAAAAAAASQAKTDFLSRMSHELRTPLNAVLGFAQLMQGSPRLQGGEHEREREQVDAILQAGWHLLNLINDVLDISRIESGHLQLQLRPLALQPVLVEAFALLRGQAEMAGVHLEITMPPGSDRWLMGDPVRLRQALVNLLSNAVKYNRRGGRVELGCEPLAEHLLLHIRDTGRGMSAEQMTHLFEPFNRLGREREAIDGTGIGLVLTRHLLALMGGSLEIRSESGIGTTASLRLPLAPAPLEASAVPAVTTPAEPVLQGRVLYIEDNPVNQMLVQEMLRPWPCLDLHLAGDGSEGLRRAAELRPDLILLDMRLPDMDGKQVLRALKADPALAAIPVVALSASAMPEDVAQAYAGGAIEYWTKPLRLQQFLVDLRRVLSLPSR